MKPHGTDIGAMSAQRTAIVTAACRAIEAAEQAPALATLADAAGLSPHHFHRVFKSVTGLTPRAYAAALRARRLQAALGRGNSVTRAMLDAGYGSSARLYEQSRDVLGMTPGKYRDGGDGAVIHFAVARCSLGAILVAESTRGLCAILLGDDPDVLLADLQGRFRRARLQPGDGRFNSRVASVVGFVEAPALGLDLPLDIRGTAFQHRVWQALREIPAGTTATYSEIAEKIGMPKAVRAVASACAANKIAVAIPCHRVVRNDGSLSGYRWGVDRKRKLLDREADAGGRQ